MDGLAVFVPVAPDERLHKLLPILVNTLLHDLVGLEPVQWVVVVDDANVGVMLKVDFGFEVPLDAGVALPRVKGLKLFLHMLVKRHSNIADI